MNLVLGPPSRLLLGMVNHAQESLPLRTKLLLSFVLLSAGLTSATLLVVRSNAERQAQQQIERDTQNAALTFRAVHRQQLMALSRKADLLAWMASMRNGDVTAIEEASGDPWQAEDCNLFVLADMKGRIKALHPANPAFPLEAAQRMLTGSLLRRENASWWFGSRSLYQVAVQPFYEESGSKKNLEGYVVVGRQLDERSAADLARITSGDIAMEYGDSLAISTLSPLKTQQLKDQLRDKLPVQQVNLAGERYNVSSIELTPGLPLAGNLILLRSYGEVRAYLERLNRLLIGIGAMVILAGSTLIFLISDTVTRPLASLVKGVQALEQGDFAHPLEAAGHDEVSSLTKAFDNMRGTLQKNEEHREQLESQLRQAQKMEALGRLAGGVAHDFNNLLTVIRGHSELILDRVKPEDPLYDHSQQIRKTADRATALTRQMLAFSRMQMLQPKVLDVNELIADMGTLLRRLLREDIEFNLCLGDFHGRVKADPGQLEQVFLNLTVNASDAMPKGGKLSVETRSVVVDKQYLQAYPSLGLGSYVLIRVTDNGYGMNAATKSRIFEPFFTTKEPGKGTGLGLATVYGIVIQSGGHILVESEPGQGTRFDLYLPSSNEEGAGNSIAASHSPATSVGPRKTVLVVEDDSEVRKLACRFLSLAGYSVLTAEDGVEALETIERFGKSIHLVLTDVVMPRMRGPEFGARLRELLPSARIIYMTGYIEQEPGSAKMLEGGFFLQKPFSRESLVAKTHEALHSKRRKREPVETAAD